MTTGEKPTGSCLRGTAHRSDLHVYRVFQTLHICRQVRKQFGHSEFLYILPLCSYYILKKLAPFSTKSVVFSPLQKCSWNGRTGKQLQDIRKIHEEGVYITLKTIYRWNNFRKDISKPYNSNTKRTVTIADVFS